MKNILSTIMAVITIVFLSSCGDDIFNELDKKTVNTSVKFVIAGQRSDGGSTKSLDEWPVLFTDVFVFDDDAMGLLDSYEHTEMPARKSQLIQSRAGRKKIVVIANLHITPAAVSGIYNYADLESLTAVFQEDNPLHPFLSGESAIDAGNEESCLIELEPMMSEIRIDGIDDRIGLNEAVMHLSGVCGFAGIMRRDGFRPAEFTETQQTAMKKGTILYCYPNNCIEETAGSPFTRLEIEGTANDGQSVKISIPVNRKGYGWKSGEEGISRNTLYLMNITLE